MAVGPEFVYIQSPQLPVNLPEAHGEKALGHCRLVTGSSSDPPAGWGPSEAQNRIPSPVSMLNPITLR